MQLFIKQPNLNSHLYSEIYRVIQSERMQLHNEIELMFI